MDLAARKSALRRATVARLLALDPVERAEQQSALVARLVSLPGLETASSVLLYAAAFPEEIDTGPCLQRVLARGQRLVLPRVDRAAGRLKLHHVVDPATDLRRGTLGIPEPRRTCPQVDPAEVDWVLVPGLLFDARCYRLGRGAGYYDRLLPTLRHDAPRWALAFDEQWCDALPVEPHDVALDGVVSPSRTALTSVATSRPTP